MSALFEPHEPHDIIVKYDMYLRLLYFLYLDKNPGWVPDCQSRSVRLVVNQSVIPVNLESSPEDRSQLSAVFTLRLFSFTNTLCNKYCLLILP